MKTKHTQGEAFYTFDRLSEPKVFRVKIGEAGTPIISMPMPLPLGGKTEKQEANAKRIVKCWNSHDELIEKSTALISACLDLYNFAELKEELYSMEEAIKKAT